jgi:hypothetical protein
LIQFNNGEVRRGRNRGGWRDGGKIEIIDEEGTGRGKEKRYCGCTFGVDWRCVRQDSFTERLQGK